MRGAMTISLLALFVTGIGFVTGIQCTSAPGGKYPAALEMQQKAQTFLWSRQAETGGWHSETHRIMKGGQALTPFILYTLLESDPVLASHASQVERGLEFVRRNTNAEGVLGFADPVIVEYPNYATSYALRLLVQYGSADDEAMIDSMRQYLEGQQFNRARGMTRAHPAFGGWGFGERGLPAGHVGYVDLSHTRRVLQALHSLGEIDAARIEDVRRFLSRLQKYNAEDEQASDTLSGFDGGFYYSPVVFLANKGGVLARGHDDDTPVFRSYATATCDGILALLATGAGPDDPRLKEALTWLRHHPDLAYPGGIPHDGPAGWHRVMQLYHLAVRAEVYHATGWPEGAREEMVQHLKRYHRADGAFVNVEGSPNKEDDPLLATTLALTALRLINAS